ncbi:hypothetical protein [Longispora albida]|uniref:hypothetical protein n=1 Tax=Longispora albida TaxID=203523 RepID=UPI0003773E7B|nr:hypothetical protein [Longispora albida]
MTKDQRLELADSLYHAAVFGGDGTAPGTANEHLDSLEADLSVARARVLHAAFLRDRAEQPGQLPAAQRAAELYAALGDDRGLAEAEFALGCYHQVVKGDGAAAQPHFERSAELARATGDNLTLSYAVRHLGFAAGMGGDRVTARALLEESAALRRKLDFPAGLAAAVLALGDLAYRDGRPEEARAYLAEATVIATECGAHGVLAWIEGTRAEHEPSTPTG